VTPSSFDSWRKLPDRPSLEQLKKQAKDLLRDFEAGNADAINEVRRAEKSPDPSSFTLADAQRVLARAYGFVSWTALKQKIDGVTVARFCDVAKAGDVPALRQMLHARPELVTMDLAPSDEHRAIHFAVLHRQPEAVRLLMAAGSDARKGVYPHRDATSAYQMATDRGFDDIVQIIDADEQHRRESMSCPNATVTPIQEQINAAIRAGSNDDAIRLLDAAPALIKACDREGGTPLHVAAGALNATMVPWLLDRNASVAKTDIHGATPLDRAVLAVETRFEDTLKRFGPIATMLRDHAAPMTLLAAIGLGDLGALQSMHAENSKAFSPHHWSASPLTMAVRHRQLEVVRLLLGLGSDPDERVQIKELETPLWSWGAPLCYAAGSGQPEIARLLLERGADPNAKLYASGDPLSWAYGAKDEQLKTALLAAGAIVDPVMAAHEGDFDAATAGVRKQPALLAEVMWGGTQGGSPSIVQWCLERIDWPPTDLRWGRMIVSALGMWRFSPHRRFKDVDPANYLRLLRMYLAHGVDPNIPGRRGESFLHSCATCGVVWSQDLLARVDRIDRAKILLDAGARFDIRDELLQSTPLAWAARWGRSELVELYLARGASPDEPDAQPWATPVAWASRYAHEQISHLLRARIAKPRQSPPP
jgi:ankyrin repeat protein